MVEKKLHYKMYKDGKKFVFAAIATMSFFAFGGVSTVAVHADTTSGNLPAATAPTAGTTGTAGTAGTTGTAGTAGTTGTAGTAGTTGTEGTTGTAGTAGTTGTAGTAGTTGTAGTAGTTGTAGTAGTTGTAGTAGTTGTAGTAGTASDTNSFVQLMADNATAAYNSTPIDDATSQTNGDGKTQYSSLNYAQNLSFESNSQDSNAPTATGVNLTGTYTQANLPQQFKNDGMTGDTFWLYSGADLLKSNVSITKNWANAGSINGRKVDFHETFHDFVAQNNPSTYGISSITGVDTNNPYLILISSNAVDNIDVYNANLQETFWFTYSDDGSIVDITKFNQANAAQNNNQIFYFLSASLSSDNGVNVNRREYVQTNDAKTVVISKNPINDPSTGFTAPPSTMGLKRVYGSNVPSGLVYTNTDIWDYQSHAGEDSNPDYYALQGGVTFADFTSTKPTLYLGAVPINASNTSWWPPINASNTSWWHGNHNKNSDFLSFVTYSIVINKKVNETINYVDQNGKTIANSYTATPITFITVKAWDGTTTYYKFGSQENPTLDNAGKPDSSWIQADNAKFGAIDNPTVKGYKVISTTAPGSDLNSVAIQTVNNTSNDLNFTVVYAPAYSTSEVKTVTETVHYIGQDGQPVKNDASGIPTRFVTITNPIDGSTATYYSTTESGQPTLDNNGVPVGNWTRGNSTNFAAIINPSVIGQHVVSTTDPSNDLTQTTVKSIDSNSGNLDFTVTYTPNQEAANVTYIDDTTGKTLSTKDLTGDYGSTDPYRTGDTIADYGKQGYQLVSDNYPTNGVVYNQDGVVQSYEVHLTHGTTQTSENQTVNETIHYVYKNGGKAADDHQATPLNFTRTVTTDKVTGDKSYGDWVAANGTSFAAVTSPAIKGYTPDQAEIGSQTVSGDSSDLDFTVVYAKNAPTITTESKTINETIHYVYKDGTTAHDDYVAKPVEFTREVSTDAVTGEKTYGSWSADQSFDAVTSPEVKGYTADKAQIDKQTVNGDSEDLAFTVTYTKNAPTITTEKKTVNETIHYQGAGDQTPADHTASVNFTRQDSTDAVTGVTTYGSWSADQSFDAVTSPELKGYTADKAQIDKQTVNGDSEDLAFTVTYTKNAPTITTEKKTVNETIHYQGASDQTPADHTASVNFTRQDSTDAVTGVTTYGSWSADQSFDAVTSPEVKGYTADKAQIDKQTVNGDSEDLAFTVTYTKNAPTITTEKKTVNETIHYQGAGDQTPADHTASVNFTRQDSTDAVTGVTTYGSWSADQSFDAVTSPELKGYTADKAQIDKQTVNGDSEDLAFTVTYTKNAPTITTEKKTVNETIHYQGAGDQTPADHTASVNFTRQDSTDAVTGVTTYGSWSADQSFDAVTSPELKGYTADKAQIDKQTVNGDSEDLAFTVTYTKNAPTITTEKKTVNETIHYQGAGDQTPADHTASVNFTRQDSTDAVTGVTTYGSWSADQSFDAVTSPELKGYTADKAQIDKQTVNGDSEDLAFTVTYTKNAPTITTEKKTVNETIHYQGASDQTPADHTASVNFTRQDSTDAVTGVTTYGSWSADQSFDAVTSPELKGYTADKAQIDKQTVNGDSEDLAFTVTYTKNAPTITTEKKTVNETIHYQGASDQTPADHTASVNFTRQDSTDAVTGVTTYGSWSADQSFDAVTSPELKGYTADKAQIDKQTVNGDSEDLAFTVTYTKNAPTITTEKKTVNETIHYQGAGDQTPADHTASVNFTRQDSTDAVTGVTTYGSWSADQSFDAVTSPELKGYTADKAQIDKQTVNGDSEDLAFTVTYTKNAPTITTEKKTVNETIHYQGASDQTPADHTASVNFTRQDSTDAVTGVTTYGSWSADQSFDAVTSPEVKGYTADKAQIDKQTVNGDSEDLAFTVTYTKNAPTITTEKKTVNETIHYQGASDQTPADHTASVNFTRQDSTDAVTGVTTYGSWSADQSFDAVTSPELKGYTADKAQIDKQTVNGDSEDLAFTVTYTKNAPTITTEKKTVNETIHYQGAGDQTPADHTASVNFTRQDSTDAVTGVTTYGSWSADQSFDAVTSPELKGYTADKAQIDKQTVNGDSEDLAFTVTYTKNAPTITTEKKTVNETIHYQGAGDQTPADHTASVNFTRQDSTDAVTGVTTYGSWSADQSFDAVTSPELKGYTADKAQIDKQTVNGDSEDLAFTVTYTKNAPTITAEKKTVNETVRYLNQNGQVLDQPHTASVDFTHQVSTDAVTGEKTYGPWSADQSFDAVTSPEVKGYTADKAQIDKQTVNGDSTDLEFTVTYTKNAPTITAEKKTVNETVRYLDQNGQVLAQPHTASVDFTHQVSTDAVTGEKTYGPWSADQSFDAVTSPEVKGYTADKAQIDKQTVNGDSTDLEFTVTYTKNAPTITAEKKTVNETVRYLNQNGQVLDQPHTASVDFTHQVSTDAVTGEKTYGSWSADQSFDAVTSPEVKGYTADKAQIDKQTVNGDSTDLEFTVTYTKNAPTITAEKKTVNETVRYLNQNGQVLDQPHTASVDFTHQVSTDAVTGEKTYGPWSADQSFDAVTSPEVKGYTADKAQIDKQTVNGDSTDLAFTVTYTKNAPTITAEKKTVNETVRYLDQNGQVLAQPHTASVDFTHQVSTDAVTGEKTYGPWSADQSFDAVTSPEVKGYTADKAQIDKQTVNGDSTDLEFTVTYTKNAPTITAEKKTVNETVRYLNQNGQVLDQPHTASVDFTHQVSTDAVTGEKTYGSWSADQSFDAVTSPEVKGYTADKAQIDKQTVNGDSTDLEFTVTYTKNAPTITAEKKTVNETVRYLDQNGQVLAQPHTASVDFTHQVSTDAVTGEKTYGPWSADQSFDAVTSPEVKGYTADKAQIDKQTVNGDSTDLEFTVTYTKNAPTITAEKKTVNETVRYLDQNGQVLAQPHTASVDFTHQVSTDAVTGEKTYGSWSADQSFDAVTSPEVKGYTADKAQIDKQTVNGDSTDLEFTVTYTKNAPTITAEKKTVNETVRYLDQNGQVLAQPHTASVDFTHQVSTDAVTGEKTYGSWSADQSFDAVTSPEVKGYTADKAQIDKQTVNGDSTDLEFTVTYTKNAPTITAEKKTVNETVRYLDQNGQVLAQPHTASVDFTHQVSTDAVTGEKTYGPWSADQSFDAVTSPEVKGYTADKAQIDKQTVNGDSTDLEFTVTYTKNAPTITAEKKTVNETVRYLDQNGQVLAQPHTASVDFTHQVSTDAVTGEKTYGPWSADQSFDAVTSPEVKGYTADKAQIDKQTVNGDSTDLEFTITYTKNAPTITAEKKTVNETVRYLNQNGQVLAQPHTASVDFTHQVSTDAVTGEKTYGPWSADQSFDAVTSPEVKGYTADKAQIDKQTVNGDSTDLEFTVTYTKTPVAGGNVTAKYVDENGNPIADDVIDSGNVGDPYSTTQKDVPGYTFKEVQGNPTGSFTDQDQTVTYVYTKNPATDNNGGTGLNQPGKPGNGTDTGNPSSNQPGNPSQPSNATNNGVINTSTNTGSKVNNGAVNSPELPQTGENNSQSQTMSFIGILLAMFGSLLGFLGIKKRRND